MLVNAWLRKCVVLAALSLAGVAYGSPQPVVSFDLQFYEVSGSTIAEIQASMFQNSPIRSAAGTFGGLTTNKIYATYELMQTQSGCEVRNPMVRLDSVVTLPQLVNGQRNPAVEREWNRFMGALRAHELLHARNGQMIAKTIISRLHTFRSKQHCDAVKPLLDNAISRLINNMNAYDRHLDETTSHGATQGAQLDLTVR